MPAAPSPSAVPRTDGWFAAPRRWTAIAPVACAVHCLAAPLLAAVAPVLVEHPALEWGFFLVSVAAAGALPAGLRLHGRRAPVLLAGAGLALWAIALLVARDGGEPMVVAGSLTTAVALLLDLRWRRAQAASCGCGVCETLGSSKTG